MIPQDLKIQDVYVPYKRASKYVTYIIPYIEYI